MQGVFLFFGGMDMCRYRQLWGFCLCAFGAGVLTGLWLNGGFLCICFGIAMITGGVLVVKG